MGEHKKDNRNTEEYLSHILAFLGSRAAQGAAYPSWTDGFSRKEVIEAWLADPEDRRVTIHDLRFADFRALEAIGFRKWNENLRLIPLWAWNYIADGEALQSISGESKIKGRDEFDLDVRFGCVAWGYAP